MSKTIIVSILGVSVIAYAVINKDSWELGTTELDLANTIVHERGGETEQAIGANNSAKRKLESGTDTEYLKAAEIDSLDQKLKQETSEKSSLQEQLNASIEGLQTNKANPENNQIKTLQSISDVARNNNSGIISLNNTSNEQINPSISGFSSITNNSNAAEANNDNGLTENEDESSDIEDDDNSDTDETNDDDSNDVKEGDLVSSWTGIITANSAGNGCEGANMSLSLYDNGTNYFLGGTVETFSGHLNIDKSIPFEITGLVTDDGSLSANLTSVFPGYGVTNYTVSYSGSLSETQGNGSWSDNRNCSGTWNLNRY